jgi:hypothetical protein
MSEPATTVCPFCGQVTPMDYVHGHAQCVYCKTNIAPCCDGATCAEEDSDDAVLTGTASPQ